MLQLDLMTLDWFSYFQYLMIVEISILGGVALRGKVIRPYSDKQKGVIHLGTIGELMTGVLIAFAFSLAMVPQAVTLVTNAGTAGLLGSYYRATDSRKKDNHIERIYVLLTEMKEARGMTPDQIIKSHEDGLDEKMKIVTSLAKILASKPFTNGNKPLTQSLREHHKEFIPDVEECSMPVMTYNALGEIVAMNLASEEMIQAPKETVMETVNLLELSNDELRKAIIDSLTGHEGYFEGAYEFMANPDRKAILQLRTFPIFSPDSVLIGGYLIIEHHVILEDVELVDISEEDIIAELEKRKVSQSC